MQYTPFTLLTWFFGAKFPPLSVAIGQLAQNTAEENLFLHPQDTLEIKAKHRLTVPYSKLWKKYNVAFYLDFSVYKTVYQHKFKSDMPLARHKNTRRLAVSQNTLQTQLWHTTIKVRLQLRKESWV